MKKSLLAIENDATLNRSDYVNDFISEYDGEVIEMCNFNRRSDKDIFMAVSKCTDIAVQTCFVNGSDSQMYDMVKLLAKIPNPINIYIAYLGMSSQNDLYEYIVDNTTPEQLLAIEHHTIYAMSMSYQFDAHIKLDFTSVTKKLHKEHTKKRVHNLYIQWYKETATNRPTGRKILVLGCTAFGKVFENLPIGQEVDELECGKLVENPRGVWIMGNGEPIMLVNESGFMEYELIAKLSVDEVFAEICKITPIGILTFRPIEIKGLLNIIGDKELSSNLKANSICEETGIEKRSNREKIRKLLTENLVN